MTRTLEELGEQPSSKKPRASPGAPPAPPAEPGPGDGPPSQDPPPSAARLLDRQERWRKERARFEASHAASDAPR